jgi:hypothetical protein
MLRTSTWLIGGLAVLGLLLTGCGDDDDDGATATAPPSVAVGTPTTASSGGTPAAGATGTASAGLDPCTLRTSVEGQPLSAGPAFELADLMWEICVGGAAAGSSEKYLFKSADGGTSWTLISTTTLGIQTPQAGAGELPNGNAAEVLFFVDEDNGWLGLSSPGQNLYRTEDSGANWAAVAALPPGLPVLEITFSDAMNGTLTTPDGDWTTSDGGTTWTEVP